MKTKKRTVFAATLVATTAAVALGATTQAKAQDPDETAVSESIGLGKMSRFLGGATPVTMDRTKIVPGTPMAVNSAMANIISSGNSSSFGGILARYDTSNFGKLFGTGTMAQRTTTNRVEELEAQGDNAVDNDLDAERMYPPRLVLDFNEFPRRALAEREVRANLDAQIENVVSRYDLDPEKEFVKAYRRGNAVVLRGTLKSARLAKTLVGVLSLQPGVEETINEIDVLEPETNDVDLFGRPALR